VNLNIVIDFLKRNCFRWPSIEHRLFHFHALAVLSCLPSFYDGRFRLKVAKSIYCIFRLQSHHRTVCAGCTINNIYCGESLLASVILRRRCSPGFELGIVCDLYVIDALSTTEFIERHCTTTWTGAGTCECGDEPSGSIKCGEFLDELKPGFNFPRRTLFHAVNKQALLHVQSKITYRTATWFSLYDTV
jgi:hypothetical protein